MVWPLTVSTQGPLMSTTTAAAASSPSSSSSWARAPAAKAKETARAQAARRSAASGGGRTVWRAGMGRLRTRVAHLTRPKATEPLRQLGFLQGFVRLVHTLQARLGAPVAAVGVRMAALDQ